MKHCKATIRRSIGAFYQQAELCKQSSVELNVAYRTLESQLSARTPGGRLRYPFSTVEYARGVRDALDDMLYRNSLEFCYWHNGELYSTRKGSTKKSFDSIIQQYSGTALAKMECGHYWIGTDKRYF